MTQRKSPLIVLKLCFFLFAFGFFPTNSKAYFILGDSGGNIYLYPSNGDGTFKEKVFVANYGVSYPGLSFDDFNGDGSPDIMVNAGTSVYILVNDMFFNFNSELILSGVNFQHSLLYGGGIVSGDLNGDGLKDAVVQAGGGRIALLLNNGDLNFDYSEFYLPITGNFTDFDIGDFNDDDKLDLVVGYYSYKIFILYGDGQGGFPSHEIFAAPSCPPYWYYPGYNIVASIAGDFNNDGYLDLIAGQNDDLDPGQAYLYLGNGTGNISLTDFYPCPPYSYAIGYDTNPLIEKGENILGSGQGKAFDFDGDGKLDIVTSAVGFGILYFKGNGDGSFESSYTIDSIVGKISTWSHSWVNDQIPPSINILNPPNGIIFTTNEEPIFIDVEYSDQGSGIDVNSFEAYFNGADYTDAFYVSPFGATVPIQSGVLPDNAYNITIKIRDNVGNDSISISSFYIDSMSPYLNIYPSNGTIINNNPPDIIIYYDDETSGIDLLNILIYINNNDNTSEFIINNDKAIFNKSFSLPWGTNNVDAIVYDNAGWKYRNKVYFELNDNHSPVAIAGENMTIEIIKDDCVEVTLDGSKSFDPDNDITKYTWFENENYIGNGKCIKAYFEKGNHNIRLNVNDSTNRVDSDNITISVVDRYNYYYYENDIQIPIYLIPGKLWIKFKDRSYNKKNIHGDLYKYSMINNNHGFNLKSGFYEFNIKTKNNIKDDLITNNIHAINIQNIKMLLEDIYKYNKGIDFISFEFKLDDGTLFVPKDTFVCKFNDNVNKEWIDWYNVKNNVSIDYDNLITNQDRNIYILKTKFKNNLQALNIANKYSENINTDICGPNVISKAYSAYLQPNDLSSYQQWNLYAINNPIAWQFTKSYNWMYRSLKSNILIAVIDSGMEYHDDLDFNISAFYDATGDGITPRQAHGMYVGGVIGLVTNNGLGLAGMTWVDHNKRIKIRSEKAYVLSGDVVDQSDIADAIHDAYSNGADVINYSFYQTGYFPEIAIQIQEATKINGPGRNGKGCIFVAATGNENKDEIRFPANRPETFAIGAINNNYERCQCDSDINPGSNYGNELDFMAPGWEIYTTTLGNGYINIQSECATSLATAHISGIAANILAISPELNVDQVKDVLRRSSTNPEIKYYETGYGLVDSSKAVKIALSDSDNIYGKLGLLKIIKNNISDVEELDHSENKTVLNAYQIINVGDGPLHFTSSISAPLSQWLNFYDNFSTRWSNFMTAIISPGESVSINLEYTVGALCNKCNKPQTAKINFQIFEGDFSAEQIEHNILTTLVINNPEFCNTHCTSGRGCQFRIFGTNSQLPVEEYSFSDSLLYYIIILMPLLVRKILKNK